jgi:transcriptional regulator with XRE-family HTH domain
VNHNHSTVRYTFGQNIKFLRETKGWSREELAKRVVLTPSTIASIESGSKFCTAETLASLANAFNVPLSRLLATTVESTPEQIRTLPERDQKIVWALVKALGETK